MTLTEIMSLYPFEFDIFYFMTVAKEKKKKESQKNI